MNTVLSILIVGFLSVIYNNYYLCDGCYYNTVHHAVPLPEGISPELFGEAFIFPLHFEENYADMAKYATEVVNLPNASVEVRNLRSYSGFIKVDDNYESNIFFWFFPAMDGNVEAPLIIWLQGGPGFSSMIGVFAENGPLIYNVTTRHLTFRESTWIKNFNVLYMDSPIGAGFSHTHYLEGYARNQSQISKTLAKAISRFYTMFKEYKKNELYIAGEGYACKTIFPLVSRLFLREELDQIDVTGIIIENGICNAHSFMNLTNQLNFLGLLSKVDSQEMDKCLNLVEEYNSNKKYKKAFKELCNTFRDQPFRTSLYRLTTGYENLYNYQYSEVPKVLHEYTEYLSDANVRKALHVGTTPFGNHDEVCYFLQEDIFKTINDGLMNEIFQNYKILIYYGKKDLLYTYKSFINFLEKSPVVNVQHKMKNIAWYQNFNESSYAGEVRQFENILIAILPDAGHFVALDKPQPVSDLIDRFIYRKKFTPYVPEINDYDAEYDGY